ncbi:cytochrome P450 2K4-like isoform 2-T2 [Mantella aurantiaca]
MFLIDPFTILLLVLLCLFLVKITCDFKQNVYPNFPPGPTPLPIIGNMHIMDLNRPYKTFLELAKKYGSVFSVQIGTQKMVILCGYETVKDALINHAEEFSERPHIPIFKDITKGYGKPFENTIIMNAAVANIIVSILLGHRFNYEDPVFLRLMNLINENVRLVGSPMITLYNSFFSVMRWLPGNHKTVNENNDEMRQFITETFTKYKDHLDANDQRNLIDVFLVKQQEEKLESSKYFHNENLKSLIGNLFAAGMGTTSTTLRWGILLMIKYPEIQKNVQDEIDKVIGSAVPQTEHRKQMPYTDAVIHEIQRFANIIPTNIAHATTQDVTLKGYFLPKGTYVIPLLASVLRDESHFEKPDEFYPQHFLDSKGNFLRKDAFLPFSAGKRSCAGENLAKMELFLFFTTLLQNFTLQAPRGTKLDLTPAVGFTTPPMKHDICAVART